MIFFSLASVYLLVTGNDAVYLTLHVALTTHFMVTRGDAEHNSLDSDGCVLLVIEQQEYTRVGLTLYL